MCKASRWLTAGLLVILLLGCARGRGGGSQGGGDKQVPPVPPAPDPVQVQLNAMTLDEKLGQLVLVGLEGLEPDEQARDLIQKRHIGGVILYQKNISTANQTWAFLNALKASNSTNKAPLLLSVDQEGGAVSRLPEEYSVFPAASVIGASSSPELAKAVGSALGEAVHSLGFNMNFAPVLDINTNPANPVIGNRAFGSNAGLVSRLGIAAMKGMQGQNVIPVVKHFPGHGDTAVDSHLDLPVVYKSLDDLRSVEMVPFLDAVGNGADAVMVAHILLPQLDDVLPASLSQPIITGILRNELRYDGVVLTDDLTMGAIAGHFQLGQAAVRSVNAGADVVMVAHGYENALTVLDSLRQAVGSGILTEETVNRSVYRILALKQKYGLTDHPSPAPNVAAVNARVREVLDAGPR